MATPSATSEASEIRRRGRRRLVGAIAIVALLVVFVPMILDQEPRTGREPALAIPPRENAPPLPAPGQRAPAAPAPQAAPAAATPAPAPAAAPSPARSAPPAAPASKAAKAPAAPHLEGFAVQVGAFKDEDTLRAAREKLAAAGLAHYTEHLDAASGGLTRLRAGPFKTRQAAEAALAKAKLQSLDGQVVTLP